MKVKDFSKEIELAAIENVNGREFGNRSLIPIGLMGGSTSFVTTCSFFGNPFYHASGLVSYAVNRIADKYSSSKLSKLFEDSKFKEYGFKEIWKEGSDYLSKHPSKTEAILSKLIVPEILLNILSIVNPPVAHGLLATSPFLYENNRTLKNQVKKAIEIGDDVDRMIKCNLTKEDINQQLKLLSNKKEICKNCRA